MESRLNVPELFGYQHSPITDHATPRLFPVPAPRPRLPSRPVPLPLLDTAVPTVGDVVPVDGGEEAVLEDLGVRQSPVVVRQQTGDQAPGRVGHSRLAGTAQVLLGTQNRL